MAAFLFAGLVAHLSANVALAVRVTSGTQQQVQSQGPSVSVTDPVGKVIELLDVLYKQLKEDGDRDAEVFMAFDSENQKEIARLSNVIDTQQASADSLKAELDEQKALREAKTIELEKESNDLAKREQELQDSKDVRAAERKAFEANEQTLADGVDALERSLVVMAKQQPAENLIQTDGTAAAGSQGAGLLVVAKKLRKTLELAPDLKLTSEERETIDGFIRIAAEHASGSEVPAFVQVQSETQSGGPYESQAGGVVETLQSVLDKAQKELDAARAEEVTAAKDAKKFQTSLAAQIETSKETITDIKTLIAQSQEISGTKEAQRLQALDLLKTSTEQKEAHLAEKASKTAAYEGRVKQRTEEALAVEEATRIMTSETAERLLSKDDGAAFAQTSPTQPQQQQAQQLAFLQVDQTSRHLLHEATDSGLAFVALKMQTHLRAHAKLDPFAKVKDMVVQMLKKLTEAQAQDAKHQAWCDSEMSKSSKNKREKEADVLKLSNRIGAAEVEIAQLTEDIKVVTSDVAAMQEANAQATEIRQKEHGVATAAMKNYKAATQLLTEALTVLKKYYGDYGSTMKVTGVEDDGTQEHKTQWGLGGGVIAILEVAVADYQKLYDDTKLNEDTAAKEFKDMINESQVAMAKFEKDLEYKGNAKVKLESDSMHMREDKTSYSQELSAIEEYISKLKEQCIAKPDTYEERKQRREQEIVGLKGALTALNSEA